MKTLRVSWDEVIKALEEKYNIKKVKLMQDLMSEGIRESFEVFVCIEGEVIEGDKI